MAYYCARSERNTKLPPQTTWRPVITVALLLLIGWISVSIGVIYFPSKQNRSGDPDEFPSPNRFRSSSYPIDTWTSFSSSLLFLFIFISFFPSRLSSHFGAGPVPRLFAIRFHACTSSRACWGRTSLASGKSVHPFGFPSPGKKSEGLHLLALRLPVPSLRVALEF